MNNFGIGVMLRMLSSNEETVNAIKNSLEKVITDIKLDGDNLIIHFEGWHKIEHVGRWAVML